MILFPVCFWESISVTFYQRLNLLIFGEFVCFFLSFFFLLHNKILNWPKSDNLFKIKPRSYFAWGHRAWRGDKGTEWGERASFLRFAVTQPRSWVNDSISLYFSFSICKTILIILGIAACEITLSPQKKWAIKIQYVIRQSVAFDCVLRVQV